MALDPHLWQRLQDHGVTEEHLELLLSALELQRSGNVNFGFVRGQLDYTELRVHIPPRSREVGRMRTELLPALARMPKRT